MDSGSVAVSKCENALNGTALLSAELVVPAEAAPVLAVVEVDSAFVGAVSTFDEGVYWAVLVRAFDPAEAELDDENDVDAPAPLAPEDAFAWMKS